MTTTVEPVATYTERINHVLALYRGCRGDVNLYVPPRQDGWIWSMPASSASMPPPALDAIEDGRSLRLSARTTSGDLPALVAIWRVRGELTREEVGPGAVRLYHKAASEDVARVRDGLARFALAPALLVDGGDEVWCAWALSTPLAGDHGRDLLAKLAERVGGDVDAVGDPGLSLPLAGKVKNWSSLNWTGVQILDASRTYTVEQIEEALSPPIDTETPALRKRVRP